MQEWRGPVYRRIMVIVGVTRALTGCSALCFPHRNWFNWYDYYFHSRKLGEQKKYWLRVGFHFDPWGTIHGTLYAFGVRSVARDEMCYVECLGDFPERFFEMHICRLEKTSVFCNVGLILEVWYERKTWRYAKDKLRPVPYGLNSDQRAMDWIKRGELHCLFSLWDLTVRWGWGTRWPSTYCLLIQQEGSCLQTMKKALTGSRICWYLDLGFPASKTRIEDKDTRTNLFIWKILGVR